MSLQVTIDPDSGYCFGVVYAIQMAEDELDATGTLYCLGDIVHNNMEVERLRNKGLKIIDHDQLRQLRDCKVLIRAHGEPPETYRIATENNIELIDASCPVVLKLQNRVRKSHEQALTEDAQIVIYGEVGHAEVNGLIGQTQGKAIIVKEEKDLEQIDFTKPVHLFSQTTKSTTGFKKMREMLDARIQAGGSEDAFLNANDTLCRQVSNREPQLEKFAVAQDVIVFVSGQKSSNGKALFGVCQRANAQSYFISTPEEIKTEWFAEAATVGISGATSTPMWLMEMVADNIRTLTTPVSVA